MSKLIRFKKKIFAVISKIDAKMLLIQKYNQDIYNLKFKMKKITSSELNNIQNEITELIDKLTAIITESINKQNEANSIKNTISLNEHNNYKDVLTEDWSQWQITVNDNFTFIENNMINIIELYTKINNISLKLHEEKIKNIKQNIHLLQEEEQKLRKYLNDESFKYLDTMKNYYNDAKICKICLARNIIKSNDHKHCLGEMGKCIELENKCNTHCKKCKHIKQDNLYIPNVIPIIHESCYVKDCNGCVLTTFRKITGCYTEDEIKQILLSDRYPQKMLWCTNNHIYDMTPEITVKYHTINNNEEVERKIIKTKFDNEYSIILCKLMAKSKAEIDIKNIKKINDDLIFNIILFKCQWRIDLTLPESPTTKVVDLTVENESVISVDNAKFSLCENLSRIHARQKQQCDKYYYEIQGFRNNSKVFEQLATVCCDMHCQHKYFDGNTCWNTIKHNHCSNKYCKNIFCLGNHTYKDYPENIVCPFGNKCKKINICNKLHNVELDTHAYKKQQEIYENAKKKKDDKIAKEHQYNEQIRLREVELKNILWEKKANAALKFKLIEAEKENQKLERERLFYQKENILIEEKRIEIMSELAKVANSGGGMNLDQASANLIQDIVNIGINAKLETENLLKQMQEINKQSNIQIKISEEKVKIAEEKVKYAEEYIKICHKQQLEAEEKVEEARIKAGLTPNCVVCMNGAPNIVTVPCMHLRCCEMCINIILQNRNPTCPNCNIIIEKTFKVYV